MSKRTEFISLPGIPEDTSWKSYLIYPLLYFFFVVIVPHEGHSGDAGYFTEWTLYIRHSGLSHIYHNQSANYMPLYLYVLKLFGWFLNSDQAVTGYIYNLKLLNLIFEFTGVFLVLWYIKAGKKHLLPALILLLNPGFIYNTLVWGQVDGILGMFAFGSVIFMQKGKVMLSSVFMLLCLNFKLQGIVFLPLVSLLALPQVFVKFSVKKLIIGTVLLLSIQLLLFLPFILAGEMQGLWKVINGSVDHYPFISMNAYNFWYFLWPKVGNLVKYSDATIFLGLSYKHWGMLLFLTASFFALWPIIKDVREMLSHKTLLALHSHKIMLAGMLLPLLFFFFNTQMHERYSHPFLLFAGCYAFISGGYFGYVIGSIAYFLNLEAVLEYLHLPNYDILLVNPTFVAALFLLTIAYGFFKLYQLPALNVEMSPAKINSLISHTENKHAPVE